MVSIVTFYKRNFCALPSDFDLPADAGCAYFDDPNNIRHSLIYEPANGYNDPLVALGDTVPITNFNLDSCVYNNWKASPTVTPTTRVYSFVAGPGADGAETPDYAYPYVSSNVTMGQGSSCAFPALQGAPACGGYIACPACKAQTSVTAQASSETTSIGIKGNCNIHTNSATGPTSAPTFTSLLYGLPNYHSGILDSVITAVYRYGDRTDLQPGTLFGDQLALFGYVLPDICYEVNMANINQFVVTLGFETAKMSIALRAPFAIPGEIQQEDFYIMSLSAYPYMCINVVVQICQIVTFASAPPISCQPIFPTTSPVRFLHAVPGWSTARR